MESRKNFNELEKKAAKKHGLKAVKNSGRGYQKGDALGPGFLIDWKFNDKSFTLSKKNWDELGKQAWDENHRSPVIVVVFEDGTEVACIDFEFVKEFVNGSWTRNTDDS